jgi:SAM-dependent methyltransferase
MSDLSRRNATGRFSGLAGLYARYRPTYPDAALDFVVQQCGLGPDTVLVDVGSGTGISTRLFAARGIPVIGIEPNEDMRAKAESEGVPADAPVPEYRAGKAEATGLPDGCAAAVLAAQAFHWFDAAAALGEFHRILRPGGWVILFGYERDERDPCTADFGRVIHTAPDAAAVEVPRARACEVLFHSPLFEAVQRRSFYQTQTVDEDGLLGRAFSASYAPREPAAVEAFAAALQGVFATHQQQGKVTLHYETTVHIGRRRELS